MSAAELLDCIRNRRPDGRRAIRISREGPMIYRLAGGGKWIRTIGPAVKQTVVGHLLGHVVVGLASVVAASCRAHRIASAREDESCRP